jgi:hypothetical protein
MLIPKDFSNQHRIEAVHNMKTINAKTCLIKGYTTIVDCGLLDCDTISLVDTILHCITTQKTTLYICTNLKISHFIQL